MRFREFLKSDKESKCLDVFKEKITYLQIATAGIHITEAITSNAARTTAHTGHSLRSVTPFNEIQASYPDPSVTISAILATRIDIIAKGDRYFQQINQYNPGRVPTIISMSSANLKQQQK